MRVVLYARVSTKDRQDHENQFRILRAYCKEMEWDIVSEYVDYESGRKSKAERDDLNAMFLSAYKKEFDLVLFFTLERFTREGTKATFIYFDELEKCKVKFHSYSEPYITTAGPFGEAIAGFLAGLAKQEVVKRSASVVAGLEKARAQGRVGGRPVVDHHKKKKVLDLYLLEKLSLGRISIQEKIPKSTVQKIIQDYKKGKVDPHGFSYKEPLF